jgi:hypothetical protein
VILIQLHYKLLLTQKMEIGCPVLNLIRLRLRCIFKSYYIAFRIWHVVTYRLFIYLYKLILPL